MKHIKEFNEFIDEFKMHQPATKPSPATRPSPQPTTIPSKPQTPHKPQPKPSPIPHKQPFTTPEPAKADADEVITRMEKLLKVKHNEE
jgi:outer membrane biosynthesis protein TonB